MKFFLYSPDQFWWACAHCALRFLFLANRIGTLKVWCVVGFVILFCSKKRSSCQSEPVWPFSTNLSHQEGWNNWSFLFIRFKSLEDATEKKIKTFLLICSIEDFVVHISWPLLDPNGTLMKSFLKGCTCRSLLLSKKGMCRYRFSFQPTTRPVQSVHLGLQYITRCGFCLDGMKTCRHTSPLWLRLMTPTINKIVKDYP